MLASVLEVTVTELSVEVTFVRDAFNCSRLTASVPLTPGFKLVIWLLPISRLPPVILIELSPKVSFGPVALF